MSESNYNQYLEKYLSEKAWAQSSDHEVTKEFGAGELLDMMRPKVEQVLTTAGILTPPSQSVRAKRFLDIICGVIDQHQAEKELSMDKESWLDQFRIMSKSRRLMQDFLAVHRTVWILEGRPL